LFNDPDFENNQLRVSNRNNLFSKLNSEIQSLIFDELFNSCLKHDVPIGKIRNLKEVFELAEAQTMLNSFSNIQSVKSISFKFEK
jgi:crotonobetainyl-CoA:carnitine CoA-transferase CaiB-like acyl-CoA transferase